MTQNNNIKYRRRVSNACKIYANCKTTKLLVYHRTYILYRALRCLLLIYEAIYVDVKFE